MTKRAPQNTVKTQDSKEKVKFQKSESNAPVEEEVIEGSDDDLEFEPTDPKEYFPESENNEELDESDNDKNSPDKDEKPIFKIHGLKNLTAARGQVISLNFDISPGTNPIKSVVGLFSGNLLPKLDLSDPARRSIKIPKEAVLGTYLMKIIATDTSGLQIEKSVYLVVAPQNEG